MRPESGIVAIAASLLGGCAAVSIPTPETLLSEDQVIDLMDHPRKWDGRVVTMQIYPYDHGYSESYLVCFETCDAAYADRSPFVIYTKRDRFKGAKGVRPAVVRARYDAGCFYRHTLCVDMRFGLFTEVE